MWEISNKAQVITCLLSMLLGSFFSLFYDFMRAVRRVFLKGKAAVFFLDFFFCAVISVVMFFWNMARSNGEVRGYIIVSCVMGFFICRILLSKFVYKIFKKILTLFKKTFGFFELLNQKICIFICNIIDRFISFFCFKQNHLKKLLKKIYELVYNKANMQNRRNLDEGEKTNKYHS